MLLNKITKTWIQLLTDSWIEIYYFRYSSSSSICDWLVSYRPYLSVNYSWWVTKINKNLTKKSIHWIYNDKYSAIVLRDTPTKNDKLRHFRLVWCTEHTLLLHCEFPESDIAMGQLLASKIAIQDVCVWQKCFFYTFFLVSTTSNVVA